ncbi:hypothetical protein FN846DRAFT_908519 [Sphaerosporella brunnea]|uniref:Uncharacterized protein n=1 Tax=Sphaerosporella brunnea TaxID=1250544 RepID=A0A5J5ETB4_9PEZI|nr:hypothetical protein FN846DRAFT_908519 [Sphaerosporella brunnea]
MKSIFRSHVTTFHQVGYVSHQEFVQWLSQEPQDTAVLCWWDVNFNILSAAMKPSVMNDVNGKVHGLMVGQAIVAVENWTLHARTDHQDIQFTLLWLLNVDRFDHVTPQDRLKLLKEHSLKVHWARTDARRRRRRETMLRKWNESAVAALVKQSKHVSVQADIDRLQRAFKQPKESATQRIQTLQGKLASVNGQPVSVKRELISHKESANERIKTLERELASLNAELVSVKGELAFVNGELVSHKERTQGNRKKEESSAFQEEMRKQLAAREALNHRLLEALRAQVPVHLGRLPYDLLPITVMLLRHSTGEQDTIKTSVHMARFHEDETAELMKHALMLEGLAFGTLVFNRGVCFLDDGFRVPIGPGISH